MIKIAKPVSFLKVFIADQISWRIIGANPSVASSKISRRGLVIKARAMASICCSPPERDDATWPVLSFSFGNKLFISSRFHLPSLDAAIRFSLTDSWPKILRPSGTSPAPSRDIWKLFSLLRFLPENNNSPFVGII